MIDMASVYAERYRKTPDVLRAAVVGQSPDSRLDPYTALNALKLVNESNRMMMASQAQQPTSSPSLVAQNMAPPPMQQGLGAMVPGTMDQSPQGMPPQQAPMPQPTMQAASGGLAGMYSPEEDFAEGGIVAFAAPTPENNYSLVRDPEAPAVSANPFESYTPAARADLFARSTEGDGEEDDYLAMLDELEGGKGSPAGLAAANKLTLATARRIASRDFRDLTPAERKTMYAEEYKRITDAAGPSPYAGMRADLVEQGKERAGALNLAQGEALLQAASDVLEGGNAIRGLAKGGAKFAKVYGEAQRADKLAKRSMSQMEFHIADAERKERMGNSRAASAAVESARKDRKDMNKAELDRDIALGRLSGEMGKINKPPRAAGGANIKDFVVGPETYLAQIKEEHPEWSPAKQKAEAFKLFQQGKSAGLQGAVIKADTATTQIKSKENTAAQTALADFKQYKKTAWKKYVADNGGDEKAAEAAYKSGWMTKNPNAGADDFDPNKAVDYIPAAAPAATSSAKPGTVLNYDANGKRIN